MLDWNAYGGAPLWGPDRSSQTRTYQMDAASKEAERQRQQAEYYGSVDEARRRKQFESDRDFDLQVKNLKARRAEIAISKGQAAADKWYKQQSIKLAKKELEENRRQFDLTHGLAVQQFQDSSLQGWTDKALALSRTPKDYFTLMRMQQGVASNAGNIPGLAWASGGQVGNTTFAGNPESNSLGNVFANMGLNGGQAASGGDWASQAAQQANQMVTQPLNLTPQQKELYDTALAFGKNSQGAAPGWYEGLDPLTRDLLQGAAEDQGLDWGSVMSRYKRSRWGGGGSVLAA